MKTLADYPDDSETVILFDNTITGHIDFSRFTRLKRLCCYTKNVISYDNLPPSLIEFTCSRLSETIDIPSSVISLTIDQKDAIIYFDKMPINLQKFICQTVITEFEKLPRTLEYLHCYSDNFNNIKNLPPNLNTLHIHYDTITDLDNLPVLPYSLRYLKIYYLNFVPPYTEIIERIKNNYPQITHFELRSGSYQQ